MARNGRRMRSDDLTVHNSTPITINVYDLLPADSKLSSVFWFLGIGLLHTGVVVNDREYAFGGHDRKDVTGVYWMRPQVCPPGARFRQSILHGHSTHSPAEIEEILREATREFLGPTYHILTRNCNHFTNYLVEKLVGKPAPKWINRAASIVVAFPCVAPTSWIEPPTCEEEVMLPPRGTVEGAGSSSTTSLRSDDFDDEAWAVGSDSDSDGGSKKAKLSNQFDKKAKT